MKAPASGFLAVGLTCVPIAGALRRWEHMPLEQAHLSRVLAHVLPKRMH